MFARWAVKEMTCDKFNTVFEANFESAINPLSGIRHMMYVELKNFEWCEKAKMEKRLSRISAA